jgi:uncharacterized membrane protein YcaP (DUF421 family)
MIETLYRSFLSFIILLAFTRLLGKRQVSEMNLFDYITGITLGSIVAEIMTDLEANFWIIIPALGVFVVLKAITSLFVLKSKRFRTIIDGKERLIINHGKILEKNMGKEKLTIDELLAMLREQSIFNIADVDIAYFESDGKLSVLLKAEKQPLTASDIKLKVKKNAISKLIIEQGKLNGDELRRMGFTKAWLLGKLGSKGIKDIGKVMCAQVDENGELYIDLFDEEEKVNPDPDAKK